MANVLEYKTAVKREVVNALNRAFGDKIKYVGLEYPNREIQYPAIYITFTENQIRNVGVGHKEEAMDDQGYLYELKHFWFDGRINFNIIALSPEERDTIASQLIGVLGLGEAIEEFRSFKAELSDADYIQLHPMTDVIVPGGELQGTIAFGDQDRRQFGTSYHITIAGEFWSDARSGELVTISSVHVYPYTPDEDPPW